MIFETIIHRFEDGNTIFKTNDDVIVITVNEEDLIGIEFTREEALSAAKSILKALGELDDL